MQGTEDYETLAYGSLHLRLHLFTPPIMTARVVRVVDPNHVHTLLLNCGAFLYIYDLCL